MDLFQSIDKVVALSKKCHARVKQTRKYTGEPYEIHPAEVSAYAAAIWSDYRWEVPIHVFVAVAWLHDCFEDTDCTWAEVVEAMKGWSVDDISQVRSGVTILTDPDDENLNRAQRHEIQNKKLKEAPRWVQGIKMCDIYVNTKSICLHDPAFGEVYVLKEKKAVLEALGTSHTLAERLFGDMVAGVAEILRSQEKCDQCDSGVLVERTKALPYLHEGLIKYIQEVKGFHCTRCARVKLTEDAIKGSRRQIRNVLEQNRHITVI